MLERFTAWQKEAEKYRKGKIAKEEYERLLSAYPKLKFCTNCSFTVTEGIEPSVTVRALASYCARI